MSVTTQTFEEFSLANPDRLLEMQRGQVREKPPMSFDHTDLSFELGYLLRLQLDKGEHRVAVNGARLRRPGGNYYIPDIAVIPIALAQPFRGRSNVLPVYDEPLPLVGEVWSPSAGDYDVDDKIPEYTARGDLEIWRLHPYDRDVKAWRRRADGSYEEAIFHGETIQLAALSGVVIDLDALFST